MRSISFSLAFSGVQSSVSSSADLSSAAFERFVEKYGKRYSSEEQKLARFEIFKEKLAFIETENARQNYYKLEVNGFADLAAEEFGSKRLGFHAPIHPEQKPMLGAPYLGTHAYSGAILPESVDWVVDGAVTPAKDQGSCGSCWTFSSTGALEGAWQVATGQLVAISEQQLVDCAKVDGLDGCNGGMMDPAFTYLEKQMVCTEESYAYKQEAGECASASCEAAIPEGGVVGYKDVPVEDTQALLEAVAQQPVATAVQGGQPAFQSYKSGILTQNCTANVDHAVLIVGYGAENGTDYWKIKNSWGPGWGEEGFIRVARGVTGPGECGVKVMPTYPVVKQTALMV